MRKLLFLTLLITSYSAARISDSPNSTMLRVIELREFEKSTGVSTRDCLVIYGEGKFHFERRIQQRLSQQNDLKILDSQLRQDQIDALKQILSNSAIAELKSYVPPSFPLAISTFDLFHVAIQRGNGIQEVGFLDWADKESKGSPNNTAFDVKQDWLASKATLEPLRLWVHELEDSKVHHDNLAVDTGKTVDNNCNREALYDVGLSLDHVSLYDKAPITLEI
jgi:hypothetical protein